MYVSPAVQSGMTEEDKLKEQSAIRLLLLHKYLLNLAPKLSQREVSLGTASRADTVSSLVDSFLRGSSAERINGNQCAECSYHT